MIFLYNAGHNNSLFILLMTWYGKNEKNGLLISNVQLVLHAKSLVRAIG